MNCVTPTNTPHRTEYTMGLIMSKKLSPTASQDIQGKVVVPSPITANLSQFLPLTVSLPSSQVGKSSYAIGFSGISLAPSSYVSD